ncbi:membrane cofactor protein-like [Myotis daubentonii]|uniref:membrane cofactor protein-like n=1 Tax=Myotis daubentonii TaxID=98922 RepID=UPI0028735D8D|nr:membrane cofactor protein-like [Myotis daubentonii]
MRASYEPLRTSSRRLESPFSWGFLGILVLALELLLPTCSDACGDPPKYPSMKPKGNPAPPYNAGFAVEYECRPGYRPMVPLVHPTSAVCQSNGTWAPPLREACTIKSCPKLAGPSHGDVFYDNGTTTYGSQVHYDCDEGYYVVGTKIRKCETLGKAVRWSKKAPTCEKIFCNSPTRIRYGDFNNSHRTRFEYKEKIIYTCNTSNETDHFTLVGESILVCIRPEEWSSDPPECKVVKCPYPSLPGGTIVSGFGKKYYYKAGVEFECNQGYSLQGSRKIVCEADNTWVPEIPRCVQDGKPVQPTKAPVPGSPDGKPVQPTKAPVPGRPTPSDKTPSNTSGAGVIVAIVLVVGAFLELIVI